MPAKPRLKLRCRSLELVLYPDKFMVIKTTKIENGTATWYPFSFRWWPGPSPMGVVIRRSFKDEGKRRKLKPAEQALYDAAVKQFQMACYVAHDQSLHPEIRHVGSALRTEAAKVIAELGHKTLPRR